MPNLARVRTFFVAVLIPCGWSAIASSQVTLSRIAGPINENRVVTLRGNVHPMAQSEFDQGPVSPDMRLDRMVLHLEPSAAQQTDLDALVEAQHDPHSPLYHQWLTPTQYGARFGASAQDLAKITAWLEGHGFTVDEIPTSNRLVLFSGTAGQVQDTFHTEIRRYVVNGVTHIANVQDPQIPEALAGVVGGVVSLHDFRRNSLMRLRMPLGEAETHPASDSQPRTGTRPGLSVLPQYSSGSTHYLFPADWATIYDLNSLYSAGTTGAGTSIAIVGRSNINVPDVTAFRTASGLVANNPTVILVSADPGLVSGDQDESTLDVEWSGAVAPSATVKFVVGASTSTSDGVDLSAQYIVNHNTAPVVSTSYGSCEQDMGSTELAFYNSLWQQAASEGISSFVSSGDSGAAGCYGGSSSSASGTGVNGLCSSPYSTCVGGTEFNEGSNYAQYWSTTNSSSYESALSYIPEEVWNESGTNGGSGLWSSGGGASVTYTQPSWQQGVSGTNTANGNRAVPDVAMSASSHDGYIIVENGGYYVIAGTSAASPSFAGVMALVVQSQGGKGQGNANTSLYPLLKATHNPFHATPSGNNSVPGVPGFTATGASYNMATGLGSVDGAVLVHSWGGGSGGTGSSVDFAITASAASGTVLASKSTTFTLTVTESGTAKNKVTLTASAPTGVTATISPSSILPGTAATVTITTTSTTSAGAKSISITGTDSTGTQSLSYSLTVTPQATLSLTAATSPLVVTMAQGASSAVSLNAATGGSFSGSITFSISGLPTGVTAQWSANPIAGASSSNSETLTLTATSTAAVANSSIVITAAGDGLTSSVNATLQLQYAPSVHLSVAPSSITMQSLASTMATFTATPVGGVAIPAAASGSSISIVSGLPKGFTATWSAASITSSGAAVWTLTLAGSSAAVAGVSTLGISAKVVGRNGTTYTASNNLTLTVTMTPPTLTVTPTSTTLAVTQGLTASDLISLTGNGTYAGPVTISVSGLPSGVTASWSSSPVTLTAESGKSTLTLTASSTATVGSSSIVVTASGDGVTATRQIALQVQFAPALQLAASPTSVSVLSLSATTLTVTATPVGGVSFLNTGSTTKLGQMPVGLRGLNLLSGIGTLAAAGTGSTLPTIAIASGLPKGFTATWSKPSVASTGAAVWTLTLTGSPTAVAGTSTVNLATQMTDSNSGKLYAANLNVPMMVTLTPPTLTATTASTSLAVVQGNVIFDAVSITGNGTYSGLVTLSVSGLPSGVTAAWSSNPLTLTSASGTSTLTLTAATTATAGVNTITVTATGDGVTASQKLTLTVVANTPTLTITPAATSMTVINPIEATSTTQSVASQVISLTGGGSFHGTVAVSVSGLPPYLTAAWSSNPVTLNSSNSGTSTMTLTASMVTQGAAQVTVTPGTYTVTVTATGDGLTVAKAIEVLVAGVTVKPSVPSLTIHRGSTGSFSITTTLAGGASGAVMPGLASSASPSGITVTATPGSLPAPGSGTILFTFTVSSTAALTSYQLDPAAELLPSATASTPTLIGWSTSPVTLNIIQ